MSTTSGQTAPPSSASKQHLHLPPHVSSTTSTNSPLPALPIEPADSRHQAYLASQNLEGRQGSTDPLLHASLTATTVTAATAATAIANHNCNASQQHLNGLGPSIPQSEYSSTNFVAPSPSANNADRRKRNAASAMLGQQNAAGGDPSDSGSGPAASGQSATLSPAPYAEGMFANTASTHGYRI